MSKVAALSCLKENSGMDLRKFYFPVSVVLYIAALVSIYLRLANGGISKNFFYHADALYLPALYKDIVLLEKNFFCWNLPPSPYFFPDMALYFLLNALVNNFHIAIMCYGFIQSLLFITSIFYLSKVIYPRKSAAHALPFFVSALLIAFLPFEENFFWLQLSSARHFGAMLMLVVSIALVIRIIFDDLSGSKAFLFHVLLLLVSSSTTASDLLFAFQFSLPVLACLLLHGICFGLKRLQTCLTALNLCVSLLLGLYFYGSLTHFQSLSEYRNISPEKIFTLLSVFAGFVQHQWFASVCFICGAFFLGVFSAKYLRKKKDSYLPINVKIYFFLMFFTFYAAFNCAVFFIYRFYPVRYYIPLLLLPTLYGGCIAISGLRRFGFLITYKKITASLFCCVAFILVLRLMPEYRSIKELKLLGDHYPEVIQCLDEQLAIKRNLRNGIGSYWQAKFFTMLSKQSLLIVPTRDDLKPFHWINNSTDFNNEFFFILLGKTPIWTLTIDRREVVKRFGQPKEILEFNDETILIFNGKEHAVFKKQFLNGSTRPCN